MNNPKGFLQIEQHQPEKRPVKIRVRDWKEINKKSSEKKVRLQAERCIDCGVPFCHAGCPLGNLIPEWNDLVYNNKWYEAYNRLSRTNNFPEFTGTLCPAPCEPACVLAINDKPVTIKQIELAIIDKAFEERWVKPLRPARRNGMKVAVIGSGPAGLAAAQQLNKKGYLVTVFERDDKIGGLLRYGIPEFKMEKWRLDRRLNLMNQEGIIFKSNTNIGEMMTSKVKGDHKNHPCSYIYPVKELMKKFNAVVLAIGATRARDLTIPGRDLACVHNAMEYLVAQNKLLQKIPPTPFNKGGEEGFAFSRGGVRVSAKVNGNGFSPLLKGGEGGFLNAGNKHVVIIGGGDTGSDCIGTALRQGAKSVTQLQHRPTPPSMRLPDNPWPEWPRTFTISSSQEEGGNREFAVETKEFIGKNGKVTALKVVRVAEERDGAGRRKLVEIPGSEFKIPADLVLLAMGYTGPETKGIVEELGLELTPRGTIATDADQMTSKKGIFAAGDAKRGQSLIVWAIAEGRKVAEYVDAYLANINLIATSLTSIPDL